MSHDLDQSTGTHAIAYKGKVPWHGYGQKLPPGESIETWLREARLEWELQRLPVQYLAGGQLHTMANRFVLARSDNHEALSIVSAGYEIVQPKEVLEFYRDLMKNCGYELETAGALDHGRKVWALARAGSNAAVDDNGGDQLVPYVLLATSCDKTLATTAAFTSVRVVCNNTLQFATEEIRRNGHPYVKVPHNLLFNANKVKKELGLLEPSWENFLGDVRKMAQTPMKADVAHSFFRTLLTQKDKPLSQSAHRECLTIAAQFQSAPGNDLATAKETLWGAVNAVTYYVDHVRSKGENRLDSAWFGSGFALKERAWNEAITLIRQP